MPSESPPETPKVAQSDTVDSPSLRHRTPFHDDLGKAVGTSSGEEEMHQDEPEIQINSLDQTNLDSHRRRSGSGGGADQGGDTISDISNAAAANTKATPAANAATSRTPSNGPSRPAAPAIHGETNGGRGTEANTAGFAQQAFQNFFYPRTSVSASAAPVNSPTSLPPSQSALEEEQKDREYVEKFWTTYDDIVFISLFTQLGMVFRLLASQWFRYFDNTFRHDSALFINLPLNCMSAFILGFLCDGKSLMQVIETRFTPVKLQQDLLLNNNNTTTPTSRRSSIDSDDDVTPPVVTGSSSSMPTMLEPPSGLRRRRQWPRFLRRGQRDRQWVIGAQGGDAAAELREVQLQAYERRIRASTCLVLFPVKKEDVDVMEHYFDNGYAAGGGDDNMGDLELQEQGDPTSLLSRRRRGSNSVRSPTFVIDDDDEHDVEWSEFGSPSGDTTDTTPRASSSSHPRTAVPSQRPGNGHHAAAPSAAPSSQQHGNVDYPTQMGDRDLDQILQDVSTNITTNIQDATTNIQSNLSRFQRVSLADGWDKRTTAKEMSADLLLGLRQGFCGALSTFSSWNSSMVALIENGDVSDAIVGYAIGLQLPIVMYRFGQQMAVYYFVWRCRRENRTDEKRGYGIRVSTNEHSLDVGSDDDEEDHNDSEDLQAGSPVRPNASPRADPKDDDMPSMRAIATALFIMSTVTQLSAIFFFTEPGQQQLAISLLFSPLGVLARWRMSKWNRLVPGFYVGTFASNMLSCALNGSLGRLLAGSPGPHERVVLVGAVSGFAGSLSSASTLVVEVLSGVDPLLFRFDGFSYAIFTIFWGMVIGFVTSASVNWADTAAVPDATMAPSMAPSLPSMAPSLAPSMGVFGSPTS